MVENEAFDRVGRCLDDRRQGRDHRLEQRKAEYRAHAVEDRPPGQLRFGDEHDASPIA
jgi:hypothetical protein